MSVDEESRQKLVPEGNQGFEGFVWEGRVACSRLDYVIIAPGGGYTRISTTIYKLHDKEYKVYIVTISILPI